MTSLASTAMAASISIGISRCRSGQAKYVRARRIMRIVLGAVGRLKDSAERGLFDRYWERIEVSGRGVGVTSIRHAEIPEGREATAVLRQTSEAQRLLATAGDQAVVVALDERGKVMTSAAFADFVKRHRDDGCRELVFLIGGTDGHGGAVHEAARAKLSLSAMTLPHGLARVVLAEQIYRAITILSGHPYHRS
jgi:23S rRNA (pseudouridine1915-N3)-methyltransferase